MSLLVSIIIPCHNDYMFIMEAFASAVNQTYDNTEIIIAKIETPKKINELIGGPIGISFSFKMINDKGKIKNKEDIRTNVVWFTKKYLLKNGFKSEYMLNLLTAIYFNKISIPVLGVIIYDYLKLVINFVF